MTNSAHDVALSRMVWKDLAHLLEYPGAEFASRLSKAALSVPHMGERAAESWSRCFSAFSRMTHDEREELYTATFDLCPACVPYVGIHLFGEENFQRGRFMAALLERYSESGFSTQGELPDHLAVLLRFAAQTNENEQRELARFCLLGPLHSMQATLAVEHPYRALLETVERVVKNTHPGLEAAPPPLSNASPTSPAGCSCSAPFLQGRTGPCNLKKEDL